MTIIIKGWPHLARLIGKALLLLLALYVAIIVAWVGYEIWPRIAGTGEHSVRMTWRGK